MWLNSDRLLLFVNVADPDDVNMKDLTLKVDGQPVVLKPAYTAASCGTIPRILSRDGMRTSLTSDPGVEHTFEEWNCRNSPRASFKGCFWTPWKRNHTGDAGCTAVRQPRSQKSADDLEHFAKGVTADSLPGERTRHSADAVSGAPAGVQDKKLEEERGSPSRSNAEYCGASNQYSSVLRSQAQSTVCQLFFRHPPPPDPLFFRATFLC